jgi:hypothetical protein
MVKSTQLATDEAEITGDSCEMKKETFAECVRQN